MSRNDEGLVNQMAQELSDNHAEIDRLLEPMHSAPEYKASRGDEFRSGYRHGPETPWKTETSHGASVTYRVHAPTSKDEYVSPGALVRVEPSHTMYKQNSRLQGYRVDGYDDNQRWVEGDGPHGQGALFNVNHSPPTVDFIAAHRDMRAHIPGLLSIAAVESRDRWGEPLTPSNDLSVHSSRIVRRLAEAGAIQMPANEQRNDLSERDYRDYTVPSRNTFPGRSRTEISPSTVQRGRQFLREALGRPKKSVDPGTPQPGSKKGKQERLFE